MLGPSTLSFSIWNALWLVVVTFFFISLLLGLFIAIVDLVRDQELGGWGKAGWMVVLVLLPLFGLLIYVIVRGRGMADRQAAEQRKSQDWLVGYVRATAGERAAAELERASALHEAGTLSDDEFATVKTKILGT